MSDTTRLLLTAVCAVGAGGVVLAVGHALQPAPRRAVLARRRLPVDTRWVVASITVGVVVLVATRWPIGALAAGALTAAWPSLFPTDAVRRRRRLEGIAKWLEDLRDLQAGSNLDLIETLDQVAARAPTSIATELKAFTTRTGHHTPLPEALLALAEDLDHPVADTAIAAMLFAAGDASGSSLHATFSMLADTARDELVARDRIDRMRLNFHRSMRRMLVILAGLIAYMFIATGDTLAPYADPAGQAWLVIPVALWALSLAWLRRLSRYERIGRYISRPAIAEASTS
ncbi:MAG: hypothetical protein AAFP84_17830 [Actinomycetota bacterium]